MAKEERKIALLSLIYYICTMWGYCRKISTSLRKGKGSRVAKSLQFNYKP